MSATRLVEWNEALNREFVRSSTSEKSTVPWSIVPSGSVSV
jgi:hypothetical protein